MVDTSVHRLSLAQKLVLSAEVAELLGDDSAQQALYFILDHLQDSAQQAMRRGLRLGLRLGSGLGSGLGLGLGLGLGSG